MLLYRIIIFGLIALIWLAVVGSRFIKNGVSEMILMQSVMFSIMGCVSIAIFYFMDKKIVKSDKNLTIFYFATSTPISIFLFIYSFNDVVGRFFNHSN